MSNEAKKFFIPVEGQAIEVSEEVYRAYYRPIWNTRYHAQKNGECRCPKTQIWKCDGVCPGCPFYAAGKKVSLETAIGGEDDDLTLGDTLADDAPTADSILMDEELLKALYDELDRLDPEGKRICDAPLGAGGRCNHGHGAFHLQASLGKNPCGTAGQAQGLLHLTFPFIPSAATLRSKG